MESNQESIAFQVSFLFHAILLVVVKLVLSLESSLSSRELTLMSIGFLSLNACVFLIGRSVLLLKESSS